MALDTLTGAFRIDPLYQRATIFMALERPREALAELEKVRDAARHRYISQWGEC